MKSQNLLGGGQDFGVERAVLGGEAAQPAERIDLLGPHFVRRLVVQHPQQIVGHSLKMDKSLYCSLRIQVIEMFQAKNDFELKQCLRNVAV